MMGGRLKANTFPVRTLCVIAVVRAIMAWAESSGPVRSANGFRRTTMKAAFGWAL